MTIILIGMPGSGKTTVGKELALTMNVSVIDTDALIIELTKQPIKELLSQNFKEIETNAVLSISKDFTGIISTGGSVVYSDEAMTCLKSLGTVIYLYVSIEQLYDRVENFSDRGIVIRDDQTFE